MAAQAATAFLRELLPLELRQQFPRCTVDSRQTHVVLDGPTSTGGPAMIHWTPEVQLKFWLASDSTKAVTITVSNHLQVITADEKRQPVGLMTEYHTDFLNLGKALGKGKWECDLLGDPDDSKKDEDEEEDDDTDLVMDVIKLLSSRTTVKVIGDRVTWTLPDGAADTDIVEMSLDKNGLEVTEKDGTKRVFDHVEAFQNPLKRDRPDPVAVVPTPALTPPPVRSESPEV